MPDLSALASQFGGVEQSKLDTLASQFGGQSIDNATSANQQQNLTSEQLATTNQSTISTPRDPNAPTLGGFAGDVGKTALGVSAGMGKGLIDLGSGVTSGLGFLPNPVSTFLDEQSRKIDVGSAMLGIPKGAVTTGEVASLALPVGGVIGGTLSLLGKTPLLAGRAGKISRAVRTTLEAAAKDPVKAVVAEAVVTAGGAGAGEATRQTTGSKILGLLAEFGTGSILGTKAAKLAYGLSVAKEDGVSSVLAERLRRSPELLAQAEQNASIMSKEGLKIRFDTITKDPSVIATMSELRKNGAQETRNRLASFADTQIEALDATSELLQRETITPDEAGSIIDSMKSKVQLKLDETISSLDSITDANTRETVGRNMFDTLAKIKDAGENEAIRLYKLNAGDTKLPEEARVIIQDALDKANKIFTKKKNKSFVIGQIEPALKAVRNEILPRGIVKSNILDIRGNPIAKEISDGSISAKGLNEIRGTILGMARTLSKSPDGRKSAARLFELNDGLTKALDLVPSENLKAANKLWKTIRTTFDRSDISFFFKENSDGLINAPETFVEKFLTGSRSTKATQDLIDFSKTDIAKSQGLSFARIQQFARQGFLADIRATTPDASLLTPVKIGSYVAKNREILTKFGLIDEFSNFGVIAKQARGLKLSIGQMDRLTLNKFNLSEDQRTLRNSLNTGAYKKQLSELPSNVRPAFKRTLLNAAIRQSDGTLLPPNKIVQALSSHKDLVADNKHLMRLSRIANIMSVPQPGRTFDDLIKFFKRVDLGEKIKSVTMERITRPLLKIARIGTNTQAFFGNVKAQDRMIDYFFTEKGSRVILNLASKNRQSKAFIRALALVRTSSTQKGVQ